VDERALAGTGHTGDDGEHAERDVHVDVLATDGSSSSRTNSARSVICFEDEDAPYLVQEATEVFEAGLALVLDGIEARMGRGRGRSD